MGFLITLLALGLSIFVTVKIFREKGSGWSKSAFVLIIFPFAWFILAIVFSGGRGFGTAFVPVFALMMLVIAAPLGLVLWVIHALTTDRGRDAPSLKMPEDVSVNYRCNACTSPNHPTNTYCTVCGASLVSDAKT